MRYPLQDLAEEHLIPSRTNPGLSGMLTCVAGNHDPLSIQGLRSALGEQQAERRGGYHRNYGRDAHHRRITKMRESLPRNRGRDCAGQGNHKESEG